MTRVNSMCTQFSPNQMYRIGLLVILSVFLSLALLIPPTISHPTGHTSNHQDQSIWDNPPLEEDTTGDSGTQVNPEEQEQNLYQLLQLDQSASSQQIKKAYRRLSVKYHPDKHPGDMEIQRKFMAIKRAYQVLIDVSKRNTYDLYGEKGLKEIQMRPKPKGGDYRTEMSVSLKQFYTGGDNVFSFRRGEICRKCKGKGEESNTERPCDECGGGGNIVKQVQSKNGQTKGIQMKCKKCQGTGKGPKAKCSQCGGEKIVIKQRNLKYFVQRGMRDGDKVLFKGESQQGFEFYPGDVYVALRQQPHNVFKRIQNDLKIKIDITLNEAFLGFTRTIKHLDGRAVTIKRGGLSAGQVVSAGQILKLKGEGMPIRGKLEQFGDLLVELNVKMPASYTQEQKDELLRAYKQGTTNTDL